MESCKQIWFILNFYSLFIQIKATRNQTICDVCLKNDYDIPFYCAIKPDLPQCNFPSCPKICEVIQNDPTLYSKAPPAPPSPKRPPHPSYLPRVPRELNPHNVGRSLDPQRKSNKHSKNYLSIGRAVKPPPVISPYNPETCELMSPNLRRIRPDSKYIEYRPAETGYQINDIFKAAEMSGLVMAEFHHILEWWAVEQSSVLQVVSSYSLTPEDPRIYYAIGMRDGGPQDLATLKSRFKYNLTSNDRSVGFAMLDPRVFGRTDEQCTVLSHVLGSDKRQYLTMRLYNCNANMGDGIRVAYGLFMFPPGSLCHRRSEEECGLLKSVMSGDDFNFNSLIQIGQTIKRFIYFCTFQTSWRQAMMYCEAKGLRLLDFDPAWDDAIKTAEIIETFLRENKMNPLTMFWTAGQFDKKFSDGSFRWIRQLRHSVSSLNNEYKTSPPPFPFSWWDNQDIALEEVKGKAYLHRRNNITYPCVALGLNPQDGGDRPKINFKAWYCNFPMTFLCYKELVAKDELDQEKPFPALVLTREEPAQDSCDGPPEPKSEPNSSPLNPATAISPNDDQNTEKVDDDDLKPEDIDPFNQESCSSKSLTVKRILPNSKYVAYQPTVNFYSVEEIKEQCQKFGLIPGEIRTREDWDSIVKSGIGWIAINVAKRETRYFYVIGMDDTKEAGKIRYNSDDTELTFSMFTADGGTDNNDRCSVIEMATDSSERLRGLVMEHVDCNLGLNSSDKIAYGLCMFPRDWNCYKKSTEEFAASKDTEKYTTLILLGTTDTRSLFFNPVQKKWDEAAKFCTAANLTLLDFDEEWQDCKQVIKIFTDKLVNNGGLFQLTPIWTSGKLEGLYKDTTGTWTSTSSALEQNLPSGMEWFNLNEEDLDSIREGVIQNGCVEATFDESRSKVRLRPDSCEIPKYFLCYRKTNRRKDPEPKNTLGITMIIENGSEAEEEDEDHETDDAKEAEEGQEGGTPPPAGSGVQSQEDENEDKDFFVDRNTANNFVPMDAKSPSVSDADNQENQLKE